MIFEVKVDDSSFREWTERSIENVRMMSDVLQDIRQIIWEDTSEMIPLEWGYLENSFFSHSQIISDYPLSKNHLISYTLDILPYFTKKGNLFNSHS